MHYALALRVDIPAAIHEAMATTFLSIRVDRTERIDRLIDLHTTYTLRHLVANSLPPHPDLQQRIQRLQTEELRRMVNDQALHQTRQTIVWDHWTRWFGFGVGCGIGNERGGGRDAWRRMTKGKMLAKACEELVEGETRGEGSVVGAHEKWWVRLRPKRWQRRAIRAMRVCPRRVRPRIMIHARSHARTTRA